MIRAEQEELEKYARAHKDMRIDLCETYRVVRIFHFNLSEIETIGGQA